MSRVLVTSWLGFFNHLTNVQARASILAADLDRHVDDVAGSEFLDDRIRLRELREWDLDLRDEQFTTGPSAEG